MDPAFISATAAAAATISVQQQAAEETAASSPAPPAEPVAMPQVNNSFVDDDGGAIVISFGKVSSARVAACVPAAVLLTFLVAFIAWIIYGVYGRALVERPRECFCAGLMDCCRRERAEI